MSLTQHSHATSGSADAELMAKVRSIKLLLFLLFAAVLHSFINFVLSILCKYYIIWLIFNSFASLTSVLWHCWLDVMHGIQTVKSPTLLQRNQLLKITPLRFSLFHSNSFSSVSFSFPWLLAFPSLTLFRFFLSRFSVASPLFGALCHKSSQAG